MRLMQRSASRRLFARASRRGGVQARVLCKQTLPERPTEFTHPTRVLFARLRQRSDFLASEDEHFRCRTVPAHVNEPAITFVSRASSPAPLYRSGDENTAVRIWGRPRCGRSLARARSIHVRASVRASRESEVGSVDRG